MNTTEALFTRWIALKGHSSAREGAKALGLSHQAPTHWKQGHNAAAHIVERMATDLGDDPSTHLIQVFLETAKGKDVATIKRLAKRMGAAAIALVLSLPLAPSPSSAQESQAIHYAKSRPKRRKREPVTEPDIHPRIYPGIFTSGSHSAPCFRRSRHATAALPSSRRTDEFVRPWRLRDGSQRDRRPVRRVGRLAA